MLGFVECLVSEQEELAKHQEAVQVEVGEHIMFFTLILYHFIIIP